MKTLLFLLLFPSLVAASTAGSIIGRILMMTFVIITVIVVTVFVADAIYKEDSIVEGEQFYPTNNQVKTHTLLTWLIIPATLFIPWIDAKPSDSGGTAFSLIMIGFIGFLTSSFLVAKKVFIYKSYLSLGTRFIGYSPITFASLLLFVFLVSFLTD